LEVCQLDPKRLLEKACVAPRVTVTCIDGRVMPSANPWDGVGVAVGDGGGLRLDVCKSPYFCFRIG
jgi:hypothetical protein